MTKVAKVGIFGGKKILVDEIESKSASNFLQGSPYFEICDRILKDNNSVEDLEILYNQAPTSLLLYLVNKKTTQTKLQLSPLIHIPLQKRLGIEDLQNVLNSFTEQISSFNLSNISVFIGIHDFTKDLTEIKDFIVALNNTFENLKIISPAVSALVSTISKKIDSSKIHKELELTLERLKEIGIYETFGSVSPSYMEPLKNAGLPINYLQILDHFPNGREFLDSLIRLRELNIDTWTCGFSMEKHENPSKADIVAFRSFAIARLFLRNTKIRLRSYSLSKSILDLISKLNLTSIMYTSLDEFTSHTTKLYLHDEIIKLDGNWE